MEKRAIVSFSYNARGMMSADYCFYQIEPCSENPGYGRASYEIGEPLKAYSYPVGERMMDELLKLISRHRLEDWNGWHKRRGTIIDGLEFSMHISFSDGSEIDADGKNSFPPNYDAVKKDIADLFEQYNNNFGIVRFEYIEQKTDWSDGWEYSIEEDYKNPQYFKASFFPINEGEEMSYRSYRVSKRMHDELLGIVKRYDLKEWNDFYSMHSSEEEGLEFHILIYFSDDSSILAHGVNCFPENYLWAKEEIEALFKKYSEEEESDTQMYRKPEPALQEDDDASDQSGLTRLPM